MLHEPVFSEIAVTSTPKRTEAFAPQDTQSVDSGSSFVFIQPGMYIATFQYTFLVYTAFTIHIIYSQSVMFFHYKIIWAQSNPKSHT